MTQQSCEHKADGLCVACYDPAAVQRYAEQSNVSFEEAAEEMRQVMDSFGLEVDDSDEAEGGSF